MKEDYRITTSKNRLKNCRDYREGYQKGYCDSKSRDKWPLHKPPLPSEPVLTDLIKAAEDIRDQAEAFASSIEADDPWSVQLYRLIDAFDIKMTSLGQWLTTKGLS